MFFKKTLIVETLFHEEKKNDLFKIPIKSSSKISRILLFPLYSFQPSQCTHTHRPHISLPPPPHPTQFTLTKTETSMYLTFILQFLTCTIQCLTSTFSLLDLPNEQSHTDFTTPYLRLSLFGPFKRTLTCTNISPYSTLILTLTYPPPMHTHFPLSLFYSTPPPPNAHSPRDFMFSSSVILASSSSSSWVSLLTSDTRLWAAMSFSILARASLCLSLSSRALDFSDVVFLSFFFSNMS